ncbi:hypothetical protein SO802_014515 [Lithocarpus litseifolius]|uniref:RNase H type-1 domain-containing protein n=1 Tax=Lithocarpus litseifolius TaxID=425828 RepID=A0AAW2CRR1_9ROSI
MRRLLEILARGKAIEFAIEAGFTDLVLEGDNSNVMKTITDVGSHVSRLDHIVLDIQLFMQVSNKCICIAIVVRDLKDRAIVTGTRVEGNTTVCAIKAN